MKFTIGRKLGFGFGLIVILIISLLIVSQITEKRVSRLEAKAYRMLGLTQMLAEKENDHLTWLNGLNQTFLENTERISVQTDHTKCKLGQWLNSEDSEKVSQIDDTSEQIIAELKSAHKTLHLSAHEIQNTWQQRIEGLHEHTWAISKGHDQWIQKLSNDLLNESNQTHVQLSHQDCVLGRFLSSDYYRENIEHIPALHQAFSDIREPHTKLHQSAQKISQDLEKNRLVDAKNVYQTQTVPLLAEVGKCLQDVSTYEDKIDLAESRSRHILKGQTAGALAEARKQIGNLRKHLDIKAKEACSELNASMQFMQRVNMIVTGVSAVLAIIICVVITRSIVHPIRKFLAEFKIIADGDLTRKIDINSCDEIGELAGGFNALIGRLHGVVAEVSDSTFEVASASNEIAASSEELSAGMTEQSSQILQITTAVDEMAQSITEVANKSMDAANEAERSGTAAEEGGEVVRETIEMMNSINNSVQRSSDSVKQLGERGEEIGKIIEVINDIADQTNLLALNAAIEAARAGEHGRGFAVVADEVRKLADRTTNATDEIAESIEAIQSETSEAVSRMKMGTEEVQKGVERVTGAGTNLEDIMTRTHHVSAMIQSIAAAAEEQSAASDEVAKHIDSISSVTTQAGAATTQAAAAASQLASKSEHLQSLVQYFKVKRNRSYEQDAAKEEQAA
ncbi:methyl-accepting chemotaxis protein [Poriferisphaera sp. WC338]|uniref:methyl-accepting chemotaxis protein n=1 Tax=Poriferisphaera sp. WC338 TaxID=3425129 RepID=UPI003D81B81A